MLKKIALAALVAGAMSTPAFAAGEACVHLEGNVNGTPLVAAQCVPLP
ncbi:MAG TPA: hypothetical protein VGX28_14475 [Frankiaceae bacterium]|jgi:hypothetical protein|nr:hypothetical protein [Frankiaceae bacterium]